MKRNYFYVLPLVAGISFLSSCDKKKTEELVEAPKEAVISQVESAPVEPKLSALDTDVKLGFAEHLPMDSELVATVYNIQGVVDRFLSSSMGGFLEELMEEEGTPLSEILEGPYFQTAMEVLGEEVFLATGKGSTEQCASLIKAYNQLNLTSITTPVLDILEDFGAEEDGVEVSSFFETAEGKDFCDHLAVVPTYLGVKVSDTEKRSGFVTLVQAQLANVLEEKKGMLEPMTKDVNGSEFQGVKVPGSVLAEIVRGSSYENMVNNLGEESAEVVIAAIEKKDVVAFVGSIGDYIVLFMGSSADELVLAESKSESFLAREDVDYLGNHAGDDVLGFIHASKELVESMTAQSGTMAGVMDVVKPVIEKADLGDTEDFLKALEGVVSAEDRYYALAKAYRGGVVFHFEEGLKMNSYGGDDIPFVNLKEPRQFAALESTLDPVFFANWVGKPEDSKLLLDYFEAIGAAAYECAVIASEKDIANFSQIFATFNTIAKDDSLAIWQSLTHDLCEGLGAEGAIVIDLKGEMPTVPMIPEPLLKMAVPRIATINHVEDRTKLAASWIKFNTATENLLKVASQMSGQNIPMQKPSKSRADGLTTWSFPVPMTTDNCKPCLSVSDDLFLTSTSPDFSEQVVTSLTGSANGEAGSYASLDFDAAAAYTSNWLEVLNANAEEVMGEYEGESFREEVYPLAQKLIKAMHELEKVTLKTYLKDGEARSELHFKTR